ncbi:MAG: TatD family hydrolase [Mariprofundus sp.]|nr:TatD family hydrolase [Mariprofundus sp.]
MQLIDSHCHLDDARFDIDRDAVLERALLLGIDQFVVPAVVASGWPRLKSLAQHYPGIHPAYGLHPWFCEQHRQVDLTLLSQYLQHAKAVGECGLDAMRKGVSMDDQLFWFRAQATLAIEFDLPLIVHAVKSVDLVIAVLKDFPESKGVIHSFYGSRQQADAVIDQGFYLGLGSAVTHAKNSRFQQVVETLPLEMLMLETDAPDQASASHRGERNEPSFLLETLHAVATIQSKPTDAVASICNANARELFNL